MIDKPITETRPSGIVPFRPEHADGVVSLILPIQQAEFGIPITLQAQPDLLDIPGFYQHGNGNFWVALEAGEIVGSIALLDIGNGQGALRKMFVAATHRGADQGVAKALLETLLAWCRAHGVGEIYLGTTEKFLAAHRFYEKNGFRELPRAELPERFPVMAVDSKFYLRALAIVPTPTSISRVTMEQTISFITLGVADLARSRAFYARLGWQESSASQEGIAFFQAGSVAFALFPREALAEDANVPAQGTGFPGFTLAHNVESEAAVLALLDEAVAAGARLVRPADRVFWGGFRGYFADLDGFLWEVCHNPFIALDDAGFISLP